MARMANGRVIAALNKWMDVTDAARAEADKIRGAMVGSTLHLHPVSTLY